MEEWRPRVWDVEGRERKDGTGCRIEAKKQGWLLTAVVGMRWRRTAVLGSYLVVGAITIHGRQFWERLDLPWSARWSLAGNVRYLWS